MSVINIAIQIQPDIGNTTTDEDIGLVSGIFRFITGSKNYGVEPYPTYEAGGTFSEEHWYNNFLIEDSISPIISNVSGMELTGGYNYKQECNFAIKNILSSSDWYTKLQTHRIYLIGKTIQVHAVIDDVFYSAGLYRITELSDLNDRIEFRCQEIGDSEHQYIPNTPINNFETPEDETLLENSVDYVPVVIGNVKNSPCVVTENQEDEIVDFSGARYYCYFRDTDMSIVAILHSQTIFEAAHGDGITYDTSGHFITFDKKSDKLYEIVKPFSWAYSGKSMNVWVSGKIDELYTDKYGTTFPSESGPQLLIYKTPVTNSMWYGKILKTKKEFTICDTPYYSISNPYSVDGSFSKYDDKTKRYDDISSIINNKTDNKFYSLCGNISGKLTTINKFLCPKYGHFLKLDSSGIPINYDTTIDGFQSVPETCFDIDRSTKTNLVATDIGSYKYYSIFVKMPVEISDYNYSKLWILPDLTVRLSSGAVTNPGANFTIEIVSANMSDKHGNIISESILSEAPDVDGRVFSITRFQKNTNKVYGIHDTIESDSYYYNPSTKTWVSADAYIGQTVSNVIAALGFEYGHFIKGDPDAQLQANINYTFNCIPNEYYDKNNSLNNSDNSSFDVYNHSYTYNNDNLPSEALSIKSSYVDSISGLKNCAVGLNIRIKSNDFVSGYAELYLNEICFITESEVELDNKKIFANVNGGTTTGTAYKSNDVHNALKFLLETYEGKSSINIDYSNVATLRKESNEYPWIVGKTLLDRKNSKEYIDSLCKQSFVQGFISRFTKYTFKSWIENRTPIFNFGPTNIIAGSFAKTERTEAYNCFGNFSVKYNYDYGSEKFTKAYSVGMIDETTFPAATDLAWKKYLSGDIGYGDAKYIWEKAREIYLRLKIKTDLPTDLSELEWYRDEGQGAREYFKMLIDWSSRQKLRCFFSVPITSDFIKIDMCDCVTVTDEIQTQNKMMLGWIYDKAIDYNNGKIDVAVLVEPNAIDFIDDEFGDIIETGSATDTITESGTRTDTITEGL